MAGIEAEIFRPDEEVRRLARRAVELGVDDEFQDGRARGLKASSAARRLSSAKQLFRFLYAEQKRGDAVLGVVVVPPPVPVVEPVVVLEVLFNRK